MSNLTIVYIRRSRGRRINEKRGLPIRKIAFYFYFFILVKKSKLNVPTIDIV